MVKVTREYESVVAVSTKLGEEKIKAIIEKFKNLIEKSANLKKMDEWGKKKLAYLINYESEGFYVCFQFESPSSFVKELEWNYCVTDGLLRFLTVVKGC